jgi:hypothetical protein
MLFVSCGTSLPQTAHETTAGLGGRDVARQQAAEQYFLGLKPRGGGTEPPHTGQLLPSLAFSPASPRTSHRLPSQSVFAKSSVWGRSQQIGQADRGARDNRHAVCPTNPPDGVSPSGVSAIVAPPAAAAAVARHSRNAKCPRGIFLVCAQENPTLSVDPIAWRQPIG